MTIVTTYLLYLALSVALTIWVARTLHLNGRVFLIDVFAGNDLLADSVNRLLVVGFYLINLGFVCLVLKIGVEVATAQEAIEALASKMGLVLLVLGGMHFFNLLLFSRFRAQAHERAPQTQHNVYTQRPPTDIIHPEARA